MDSGLAAEATTLERIEAALTVIACAMMRKRPHELFRWARGDLDDFLREHGNG